MLKPADPTESLNLDSVFENHASWRLRALSFLLSAPHVLLMHAWVVNMLHLAVGYLSAVRQHTCTLHADGAVAYMCCVKTDSRFSSSYGAVPLT
jgi:hypothetical protein